MKRAKHRREQHSHQNQDDNGNLEATDGVISIFSAKTDLATLPAGCVERRKFQNDHFLTQALPFNTQA